MEERPLNEKGKLARKRSYHGLSKSSVYKCYTSMIARCTQPWRRDYKWYGGRGIKVCNRWLESIVNFYADMGERPGLDYELDRIDPDKDYEPSNCRWITKLENSRNQRRSKIHSHEYIKVRRDLLCEHCRIKCKIDPID